MKKALSIILVLALACSLFGGVALAATSEYALTGTSVMVDGTADQTVDVVFKSVPGGTFKSFEADWSLKETQSSSYLTLSALTSDKALDADENDPATGRVVWTNFNFSNDSYNLHVTANGAIWTATYKVDKNTPAGEYTVSLNVNGITDSNGDEITDAEKLWTATITVTNPAEGYTATVAADKTTAAVNDTVEITLDVTNSDKTTFNTFQGKLTYNSSVFTYNASGSTLGGFDVSDSSGELTIMRHGSDVTIPGSGAELILAFTAKANGTGTFTLAAGVSEAAKANKNIPEATVVGTPSVTVSQTYTVTFVGGDGATGNPPALTGGNTVADGTKITLPNNTFEKEGYTFSKWSDGTNEYDEGDEYTVTGNVTFTAQWTENTPEPKVTFESSTNYCDGYTLIKATIENADGNVPTYNEMAMFKVKNVTGKSIYDENAYYYVVKTADYDAGLVSYAKKSVETITKDGDANQTGLIDINDAQFIYNLYNGVSGNYYETTAAQLLASDVNGDGKVNVQDCTAAIDKIQ